MRKMGILGLFFMAIVFIQCDSDPTVDGCSVSAVVRDLQGLDGCGFVFELEDGTLLEPVRSSIICTTPPYTEDPLYNFNLYDGQAVSIAYEETQGPSICMTGTLVKITCITPVGIISEE